MRALKVSYSEVGEGGVAVVKKHNFSRTPCMFSFIFQSESKERQEGGGAAGAAGGGAAAAGAVGVGW